MIRRCAVLIFFLLFSYSLDAFARDESLFPLPAALERDVEFWKRVYTEVTTSEGFIHDDENLAVVYEKIRISEDDSRRARENYIKGVKLKYDKILRTLAKGKRTGLTEEEKRVLDMWPPGVSNNELYRATKRIRFQLGQANKFRAGLIRSGKWKPYIHEILDSMGLPREIASLPHVESSFNHKAYSKVGAAGMWQFMRGTGRRFMRVDHVVDERMDPFKATIAAARLLENNYAVTGAWPLAITAYNHGAAGMRRAATVLGTTDIVTVVRRYNSRSFGFASRNFYVAFLAANEIDSNPEKFFGKLDFDPPADYEFIPMPAYMNADTVVKALNVDREIIMESNLALRPAVWNGNKLIPKGYELRIPRQHLPDPDMAKTAIAKLASEKAYAEQKPDRYHRVQRGQTLSTIAARYGVRMNDLIALNNLRSRHQIRVGQVLRLPQPGKRQTGKTIMVAEDRPAVVEPRAIPESGTYSVRRGDTVDTIARRYGISVNELLAINNIDNKHRIYPGQRLVLTPPEAEGEVHIVKAGDSIARIARRYGKNTSELLAINNLSKRDPIFPGQKLLLARADAGKLEPAQIAKDTTTADESQVDATQEVAVNVAIADESDAGTPEGQDDATASANAMLLAQAEGNTTDNKVEPGADEKITNGDKSQETATTTAMLDNADGMKSVLGVTTEGALAPLGEPVDESAPVDVAKLDDKNMPSAVPIDDNAPSDTNPNEPTESLGDSVISESQTELAADPTDYSVSKNNTIEVQAAETLGHYAEWLQLRASQLRRVNRMSYGKPVVIGKRIKLIFTKVTPAEFEEQRTAYHRALQEEFFEQFQITGSDKHKIRRGQSVWKLAKRTYKIPIWLLRQYNPDLNLDKVQPGAVITFPKIEARSDENIKTGQQVTDTAKTVAVNTTNP